MRDIFGDERDQLERDNWAAALQGCGPGDEEDDETEDVVDEA